MMVETVRREIARAFARVRSALRAVQTGLVIATRVQRATAQGLADETLNEMELFQHFGFSSAPPDGTQLIVIPLGGRTSAAVVVATEHGTYRFKLDAKGEAALYNEWGDVIHMRQDRTIHVVAALQVLMDTPLLKVNGQIHATGIIKTDADVLADGNVIDQASSTPKSMSGMRQVYDTHTHPDPQGGSVGTPNQST